MSDKGYEPAPVDRLAQEARDWDTGRLTPAGWTDAPDAIPSAGASTAISLRIPKEMLAILKGFAQREGIGYQVLIKRWLDDRLREEGNKLIAER